MRSSCVGHRVRHRIISSLQILAAYRYLQTMLRTLLPILTTHLTFQQLPLDPVILSCWQENAQAFP